MLSITQCPRPARPSWKSLRLNTSDRAYAFRIVHVRVGNQLSLVMSDLGLRDGTLDVVPLALGGGMVGWQHR